MQENRFKIIGLLKEVELKISELYKIYAEKIPEYKDFFETLSQEEIDHHNIISELGANIAEGRVSYVEDKFKVEEIQAVLALIKVRLDDAKAKEISKREALNIGYEIENLLVEKAYFETFKGISKGSMKFLEGVANAEKIHRDKFKKLLPNEDL